jgi:hypothetical protein
VNGATPSGQPLIEFRGPVTVHGGRGAVTLLLRGCERSVPDGRAGEFTEFVLAGAHAEALPAILRDARVFGPGPGATGGQGLRRYRIEAAIDGGARSAVPWSAEVLARSVQLHREAARAFYRAVPPPHLPFLRRLGWLLLLSALRLPGAARIVERIRGAT